MSYDEFKTGLSFREVYYMIWGRKWKRRHGVLGKWHELKKAMYLEYLNDELSRRPTPRNKGRRTV
jgi:hypothetical protein